MMHYRWLPLLCLLGLCGAALPSQAQETTSYSRPQVPIPDPVFVLNSRIIINGALAKFTAKDTKAIQRMVVYKGPGALGAEDVPPHLRSISSSGLIDIASPKRVPSKSLAQVARQLGLRGPLLFALNGHPLDPLAVARLRIAPAAIGQLHLVRPTAEHPATRLDIWLVAPPKPDSSKYPPGTIFLR